ncbi:MAG: hypothetical protein DMD79_06010 [Candidatus Rokuibacteriota bacterium]|nr:MAG: hypothetical protein DMD79_06010 [Candidatus Rokubacteria bacterium]
MAHASPRSTLAGPAGAGSGSAGSGSKVTGTSPTGPDARAAQGAAMAPDVMVTRVVGCEVCGLVLVAPAPPVCPACGAGRGG